MANFGPLTAEIGWGVWGTPANFNGFRVLAALLQGRRLPEANKNFARCLVVSWAITLYMYTFGGYYPVTEFCPARIIKINLCIVKCQIVYLLGS